MSSLDTDPDVINWASEEIIVPYHDPVTKRFRRYFPDFLVKRTGEKIQMVEIKPAVQQEIPRKGKKSQKRFLTEAATYLTNQAKWEAAKLFCKSRGWEFVVMNERDLGIKGRRT